MHPTKLQVNWPFGSGEKRKIDVQDGARAVILDFQSERFYLFLFYKSTPCFLPSFKSTGLLVQEMKQKKDFQDGDHLGFLIGKILVVFDLQVAPMLPTKF